MPRYYFNIRDGYDLDEDEEGVDLPSLDAAKAEAQATVEELRDELGADANSIQLEVTDEEGHRLFSLSFARPGHGRRS